MFDIGWSEMAVIALLALLVLGPKELPKAMRTAAKWAKKARSLAREFQSGVDDMIREADLEDARQALKQAKSLDIDKLADETIDPSGSVKAELKELDKAAKDTAAGTADGTDSKENDGTVKPAESTAAVAEKTDGGGGESGKAPESSEEVSAADAEKVPATENEILPPSKPDPESLLESGPRQGGAKA